MGSRNGPASTARGSYERPTATRPATRWRWGRRASPPRSVSRALESRHLAPGDGPVLVTGASGGVGSFAVILLAAMGYDVLAATRTPDASTYLTELGARDVVSSDEIGTDVRPLSKQRWAGAVDTVGGSVLAGVVSATNGGGVVAACGNAGGMDFPSSVAPFILRGVTLVGIDSVRTPLALRNDAWALLAARAPHDVLGAVADEIALADAIPTRAPIARQRDHRPRGGRRPPVITQTQLDIT